MKRYKVVDFETKDKEPSDSIIELLLELVEGKIEICLEEVKEEKECPKECYCERCERLCPICKGDHHIGTHVYNPDQPKEENVCVLCHKHYDPLQHTECIKDQPPTELTPKDVRMSSAMAAIKFIRWLDKRFPTSYCVWDFSDEELDRLFQEFLKERLNK